MRCLDQELTATGQPGVLIWFPDHYAAVIPPHHTAFSAGVYSHPNTMGKQKKGNGSAFQKLLTQDL